MSKTFSAKNNCVRDARKVLGPEATPGMDFALHQVSNGWQWEAIPVSAPPTEGAHVDQMQAPQGTIKAMDIGKNEVWVKPDDPCLVDGIVYPNKARATEARKLAKARKAAADKPKGEAAPKAEKPKREGPTKNEQLIALLSRPGGVSSAEVEEAFGWAPHSVRGALGTLRAKRPDLKIESVKRGPKEPTVYMIKSAPKAAEGGAEVL